MPRNKKSFINKKAAVSYRLVHGSQTDPLVADETAPQHVLLRPTGRVDVEKRREEQRHFGVFFCDNYDYMQHLKELVAAYPSHLLERRTEKEEPCMEQAISEATTISLPPSAVASEFETEDVGLLDMDPDLEAVLDDNFDFDDPENALDDDFITKASDVM